MDEARDLLDTGARSADDTDRAPTDAVRESEPDAVHDRGAALGPHDDQAEIPRAPLEGHLVGQGDAVAEQEHVKARRQRLVSVDRRVRTGYGDQGEIRRASAPARAHDR